MSQFGSISPEISIQKMVFLILFFAQLLRVFIRMQEVFPLPEPPVTNTCPSASAGEKIYFPFFEDSPKNIPLTFSIFSHLSVRSFLFFFF